MKNTVVRGLGRLLLVVFFFVPRLQVSYATALHPKSQLRIRLSGLWLLNLKLLN